MNDVYTYEVDDNGYLESGREVVARLGGVAQTVAVVSDRGPAPVTPALSARVN